MKNKWRNILLASTLFTLFACEEANLNVIQPQTIFEGKWTWEESHIKDKSTGLLSTINPSSEGYSWQWIFYDSNGAGGKLQTYKKQVDEKLYNYEYITSDSQFAQKLNLSVLSDTTVYYWTIETSNEERRLILRSIGFFTENCCDDAVEHDFVFIK